jgi:hypothetical protein
MDKDKLTTIIGGIGGVAMAVQPAISALGPGSLKGNDWTQLAFAGIFAVLGFFTNKNGVKKPE